MFPFLRPLFRFQVPIGKMDPNYQHPLIHIYLLKRRKEPLQDGEAAGAEADGQGAAAGEDGAGAAAGQQAVVAAEEQAAAAAEEQTAAAGVAAAGGCAADAALPADSQAAAESTLGSSQTEPSSQAVAEDAEEHLQAGSSGSGSCEDSSSERSAQYQQQFQTRRQGAMLARLLKDVKLGGGSEQPS